MQRESTPKEERLPYFKAYDVRGKVPDEINEELAYFIGRAYVAEVRPGGPVAVGRDVRVSSPDLQRALIRGLNEGGADALDIGLCGTEMVYFAAARPGVGGGVMITASHNPRDENGIKMVRGGAVPMNGDRDLPALERRVRTRDFPAVGPAGVCREESVLTEYVRTVLGFIDPDELEPMTLVANAGNGCAGPIVDQLAERLPFNLVRLFMEPDGRFPNGVPNPLLPENREATSNAVRRHSAGMGVAWDGDFDRCFFFDESGRYVEGYYVVGLLAERLLEGRPKSRILHDTRLYWNTVEIVRNLGGIPVMGRTGHAFMKALLREVDGLYGGEMSAHHYFKDFFYCDSGMIPWLLTAQAVSRTGRTLAELVGERMAKYPCSGEINRRVVDPDGIMERVLARYASRATEEDHTDGVSLAFQDQWRFNLRKSNTEPLLRLNVESRENRSLMESKTDELLRSIDQFSEPT